ncbi:DUF6904 family protein [Alkaliphilus transvaalensis]|uniref:DUF6904 family protein n=1 Tax=Alkaliphilus transvaalensis TaxID=114628 RepID=UPI00047B8602|nr:hypothetical protein [Alkaliphilus transvaalensis]
MLKVKNTPNNLGVEILGDLLDFEKLYEALHTIIGDEEQYPYYNLSRIRILGLCYDIRHAIQGDYEYEFVENGINSEILKVKGFIAPDKNLYLKIRVFWPEILFILIVLNDFIILHAKRNTKDYFDILTDRKNIWDDSIAQVRLFQSVINNCIKDTIPEVTYKRMLGYITSKQHEFKGYLPHYIDFLNLKFIHMEKEIRLKNISIMARRIAEQGKEYEAMVDDLKNVAREHDCPVEHIQINMEYPEDFEW